MPDFAKYGFLAAFLIALTGVPRCMAQERTYGAISGHVYAEATGKPLPGAHVFLDGTTLGDATDAAGAFRIDGIPPGRFELIASMVGFEQLRLMVDSAESTLAPLRIELVEKVFEADEIEIVGAFDPAWRKHLERFTILFLGRSAYARNCELLNPEVLDFEEDGTQLIASAKDPLRIENRSLGYRLTFYLGHFKGSEMSLVYEGKVWFQPIEPESRRDERRWRARRREAYKGSLRHFLRALADDRVVEEGFRFQEVRQPGLYNEMMNPDVDEFVEPGSDEHRRWLYIPRSFVVIYRREIEPYEYVSFRQSYLQSGGRRRDQQVSWLSSVLGPAEFDLSGRLYNPRSLMRYGYWGWEERVSTLLPWDYEPDAE